MNKGNTMNTATPASALLGVILNPLTPDTKKAEAVNLLREAMADASPKTKAKCLHILKAAQNA
jgi:ribosomal protein S7